MSGAAPRGLTARRPVWSRGPDRSGGWLLASLVVLALVARIVAVLLLAEPTIHGNESVVVARSLAQGRGFAFDFYRLRLDNPLRSFMPPLYPLLIAAFLRYAGNPSLAFQLFLAILSSITVLLIYFVALKLSGDVLVGLLAGAGVALYPVFIVMAASPLSVTFDAFLLALLALVSLILRERMDGRAALLTGLVLGLLLLVRPNLLGLLPLLLIWLWLNRPDEGRRLSRIAAILVGTMLLIVLPWLVRTYQVHGRFVFFSTNAGMNLWNGNNPFSTGSGHEVDSARLANYLGVPVDPDKPPLYELQPYPLPPDVQSQIATIDEIELDRRLRQAALAFVRDDPGRWLELVRAKLLGFWWFRANVGYKYEPAWATIYRFVYGGLLVLTVAGIGLSLRRWRAYLLLYGLLAYATLTVVVFHVQTRFRWEVEAFFIVFAALAVAALLGRLGWRPRGYALSAAFLQSHLAERAVPAVHDAPGGGNVTRGNAADGGDAGRSD